MKEGKRVITPVYRERKAKRRLSIVLVLGKPETAFKVEGAMN